MSRNKAKTSKDTHFEVNVLQEDVFHQALKNEPPQPTHPAMLLLYLCCAIGFLNSTTNGYEGYLMNGLLINTQFTDLFKVPSTGEKEGILNAMYQIGGVSALPFVGPATDTWGRRIGMMIGSIIIIVGAILTGSSSLNASFSQFLAGRFSLVLGFLSLLHVLPCTWLN
jgi:MFS family permease